MRKLPNEWWKVGSVELDDEGLPIKPKPRGFGGAAKDYGLGFASGAMGAAKSLSDAFGADNAVSKVLGDAQDGLDAGLSQEAKDSQAEQQRILNEAKGLGFGGQVAAGVRAFAEAPVQTIVQGAGSIAPYLASAFIPGGAAATAARVGMGLGMGAGSVKGSISDEVSKRELAAGKTPEQAAAAADAAQAYTGPNTDQIALGAGLGVADAAMGATPVAAKLLRQALGKEAATQVGKGAAEGLLKAGLKGAAEEMPTEFAQGTQEQVAANIAAQRAGYQAGTWDGAIAQGTMEALASAGPGAGFGAVGRSRGQQVDQTQPEAGQATPSAPADGGLSLVPQDSPVEQSTTQSAATDADLISQQQVGGLQRTYDPRAGVEPTVPLDLKQEPSGDVPYQEQTPEQKPVGYIPPGMDIAPDVKIQPEQPAKPFGQNFVMPGDAGFVEPARQRPSVAMGLNPLAGPLSASAAVAVDSGASPAVQSSVMRRAGDPVDVQPIAGAAAQIGTPRRLGESPIIDVQAREIKDQQAIAGPATNIGMTPRIGFDQPQGQTSGTQADQAFQTTAQLSEAQPPAVSPGQALALSRPIPGFTQEKAGNNPGESGSYPGEYTPDLRARNLATLKAKMLAGRKQPDAQAVRQANTGPAASPVEPLGQTGFPIDDAATANAVGINPVHGPEEQAVVGEPRALSPGAGRPEQTGPTGPVQSLSPQDSRKLQEAHKALGYGVTQPQVQSMRDRVAQEIGSGTTNNGGVAGKLTPIALKMRRAKLERLDADLALFGNAPTAQAMQHPIQQQQAQPLKPAAQSSAPLGRNGMPVAEGGKPFKTKAEADTARKLQPMMRVKKEGKGFVLVEKTAAQIAAQANAARRNLGRVGQQGKPLAAHEFLASDGGLSMGTMADLGFDKNVSVGSKWLFTKTGKTFERMTEALQQHGYMEGTDQNPAIDMVKRSANGQPQYTADGWGQIAKAEANVRFEDHLAAQQDAAMEDENYDPFSPAALYGEFDGDDLHVAGYDAASDSIKQEVAALLTQAKAIGIDTEDIQLTAHENTRNESEQAYYERVRDELHGAINASTGSSSNRTVDGNAEERPRPDAKRGGDIDSGKGNGSQGIQGADGEGLTAYTPAEVTARQDAAKEAEATAKRAEDAATRAEAAAKQASEIAQRSVAAADTFELGQSAEENLSGQEGLKFSRASENRAARAALARIMEKGVTSPDDLRDLLRVPGYSKWAKSTIAGDVAGAAALRRELQDAFPGSDWKAPKLIDQGIITIYPDWVGLTSQSLDKLTKLADKYDTPIGVRGGAATKQLVSRLDGFGFELYNGLQERADRMPNVMFGMIRPAGGITATTPLFSQGAKSPRTPISTITQAITKAYGNLLTRLEGKGLVTLTQTEEEAIAAAAQARADQNGGDVEAIKESLRKSVLASQRGTTTVIPENNAPDLASLDQHVLAKYLDEQRSIYSRMKFGSPEAKAQKVHLEQIKLASQRLRDGSPKRQTRPSDDELSATYDTPQSVPSHVVSWLQDNNQILTSDATDAVRWARIIDTASDDRYPAGQITLYRATTGDDIRPGDWVTTQREYAEQHLSKYLNGGSVVEIQVDGKDVLASPTGNSEEAIYAPLELSVALNEQSTPTSQGVDIKRSADGNLEGFFDPATGKSFLIADNLTTESAPATLMHEVGIHMAADGKLEPLFKRAGNMLKLMKNDPFIKRVQSRMDESGETSNEEAAAYIVTEYEKDRTNAPASVKQLVKDFMADVRAWLFSKGVIVSADKLTVADIAAVARANAQGMANGDGQGDVRFNRNVGDAAPDEAQKVQAAIEGKSLIDAANFVVDTGEERHRVVAEMVAEKLKALQSAGVSLDLKIAHRGFPVPTALFNSRGYTESAFDDKGRDITVWLNGADVTGKVGTDYETLLHELVHAATMGGVMHGSTVRGSPFAKDAADLMEVTDAIASHINKRFDDADAGRVSLTEFELDMRAGANNAFTKDDETLAWALSSVEAQQYLETIPNKKSGQTMWGRFVQAVRSAIGLEAKSDTALSEVLRLGASIMSTDGDANVRGVRAFWHKRGLKMATQQVNGSVVLRNEVGPAYPGSPTHQKKIDQTETPEIRFRQSSVAGGNTSPTGAPTASWDAPIDSKWDDYVFQLQDKLVDLKRVTQAITKFAGNLADDINVYLQEELFHGRTAKRAQEFTRMELEPALKQLARQGMQLTDLEEYMHARHAKEANRVIAERNPTQAMIDTARANAKAEVDRLQAVYDAAPPGQKQVAKDALRAAKDEQKRWRGAAAFKGTEAERNALSGMSNAAADAYFSKLSASDKMKLDAVAKKFDDIMDETSRLMVSYELESQDTIDSWGKMYQHYIPLQREDKEDSNGRGIGQGFSIKGRETKGRTGSTRKVVDIVANIAAAREKTVVRGEKNRVAQALVGLVTAHPNQDFWKVGPPEYERVFNPSTGKVENRVSPAYKSLPNVVVAKVAKGGMVKEVAVTFEEDNARAVRMAGALKNLDTPQVEGWLGTVAKMTRYFSSINTQYNPVFGVVNLVRDVQGAMINLQTTEIADKKAQVASDAIRALSGIYSDIRATRNGGVASSAWSTLYEQFQEDGGQTGFRNLFETTADRTSEMNDLIDPEAWAKSGVGKFFSANGQLTKPLTKAKGGFGVVMDWLSDYNEAMENGVRLAAYKAALDKGMTRPQAASLAKNLTVNFNRKGQSGAQAGAVYAFFNASMQGTARLGQVLFTMEPGKPKTLRLSPLGKKVVYGGVLLGSLQALALSAGGFGDDEPPDFVRERSLIIPTGDKTYVNIPMPLGLHVIPNIGRIATEFALSGFKNPAQRMASLAGLFADSFNPIGNAGLSMQTIAPTVLDPLVALTENKDWTGKPISRVSSNKDLPGYTQHKDSASVVSKLLAEAINTLSGGNQYVAGVLSPTPDQIDYLAGQLGGGVWRELSKVEQTATNTVTGEETPLYKIPLVGRFVGSAAGQSGEGNAFHSNAAKLNRLETEIKGLMKDGKAEEAQALRASNPESRLIIGFNMAERRIQKLRKEKSDLIKSGAEAERVKAVEQRITAVMSGMNKRMATATGLETAQ